VATAAQEAAAAAAQEQRELAHAREQTQARLTQVLEALSVEQRQALAERAQALVSLPETTLGYSFMLRWAREELLLQEQLGFDRWPQLVAQVRARATAADGDEVLEACRLEAILDDVLVVSVPTAAAKAQFTARYLRPLEALARTLEPPYRLRVFTR